jgi:hypothetical protein
MAEYKKVLKKIPSYFQTNPTQIHDMLRLRILAITLPDIHGTALSKINLMVCLFPLI